MSDGLSEAAKGTYFKMKPILVQREKWERSKGGQLMEMDNIAEQVEWEKQQGKEKQPCPDEFVEELRIYAGDTNSIAASIAFYKAADTIERQQAEIDRLKGRWQRHQKLWDFADLYECEGDCSGWKTPYGECPSCIARHALNECGEIRETAIQQIEQALKEAGNG